MVTGTGQVRPHWQNLMGRLSPLGPAALEDRHDEAVQLLRQHGVTYAVYGDPQGGERPWPLDLIPFIIPAEEWRAIESAVIQRARLLNAVLADVYGAQSLISRRRIAAALADPRQFALPAALPGHHAPGRHVSSFLRLRSRPHAGRAVGDPVRPHPGAERRRLCAGESQRHRPGAGRQHRRQPGPAAGALLRRLPRQPAWARPAELARRAADTRLVQRDLFRACLSRPPSRHHPGRGQRPDRPRPAGLSQDPERAGTGRRHPAPAGRRFLRPGGAARQQRCWRRRDHGGGAGRQRGDRQRAGQRRDRGGGIQAAAAFAGPAG